jgi:hypothetical protein
MACLRLIRAMNAVPVKLAWTEVGKIYVPDLLRSFRYLDSGHFLMSVLSIK